MKYVIFECTGRPAGGLADRFKGLISTYALAKVLKRDFIINWTYPFKLTSAVESNKYNWLPRPIEGKTQENYFLIDNENFNIHLPRIKALNEDSFPEDIVKIRCNINFINHLKINQTFGALFEELFKPKFTPITKNKECIGLSARFGGNQSNWPDHDFNRVISFDYVYEKIQEQIKTKNLFVCSDSNDFLEFLKDKNVEFLSTENYAEHIDYPGCTETGYKKAFEDFFALRECNPIFTIKGELAKTVANTTSQQKKLIEL
jgi:hypothetical protein